MRKRIFLYGALAIFLLGYFGFFALVGLWPEPTKADYDRLEIGMTKSGVRSVLGPWPDNTHHWVKGQVHEDWLGDEGAILLAFDSEDRLIWKDWVPEWKRRRPSLLETIEGLFIKDRDG